MKDYHLKLLDSSLSAKKLMVFKEEIKVKPNEEKINQFNLIIEQRKAIVKEKPVVNHERQ